MRVCVCVCAYVRVRTHAVIDPASRAESAVAVPASEMHRYTRLCTNRPRGVRWARCAHACLCVRACMRVRACVPVCVCVCVRRLSEPSRAELSSSGNNKTMALLHNSTRRERPRKEMVQTSRGAFARRKCMLALGSGNGSGNFVSQVRAVCCCIIEIFDVCVRFARFHAQQISTLNCITSRIYQLLPKNREMGSKYLNRYSFVDCRWSFFIRIHCFFVCLYSIIIYSAYAVKKLWDTKMSDIKWLTNISINDNIYSLFLLSIAQPSQSNKKAL